MDTFFKSSIFKNISIHILASSNSETQEHIKLIDRLSEPSSHLIHHITHSSEEESTEPNTSCFICIQVHGFRTCNPDFCKKASPLHNTAEQPCQEQISDLTKEQ